MGITIKKPTLKEIRIFSIFFFQWDNLQKCDWDVSEWDDSDREDLPCRIEQDDTVQEVDFFSAWYHHLGFKWMTVPICCEALLEQCTDPDSDILKLPPKFLKNLILEESGWTLSEWIDV